MSKAKIDEALKLLSMLPNAEELIRDARLEYVLSIRARACLAIPEAMAKPRIKRIRQGVWWCCDDTHFSTCADTPKEAYEEWSVRRHLYTRISRRGVWNKKDCLNWAKSGSKPVGIWIGNKKIVGYDHATDELVLRG